MTRSAVALFALFLPAMVDAQGPKRKIESEGFLVGLLTTF